jgi:hypothetical protein
LEFPFKRTLFALVIATIAIPFEVTLTANYLTVYHAGFYDTMVGLVLPFLASGFGIFLLRQAFLQVPKEIREAATIDGLGEFRFFWRVGVPLVRPMLGGLALVLVPWCVESVPLATHSDLQRRGAAHRPDRPPDPLSGHAVIDQQLRRGFHHPDCPVFRAAHLLPAPTSRES